MAETKGEGGPSALTKALDRLSSDEDVLGVSVTDDSGLCLGARGTLNSLAAAHFQGVLDAALELALHLELEKASEDPPIISIQTDKSVVLISNLEGFTTSVHKKSK